MANEGGDLAVPMLDDKGVEEVDPRAAEMAAEDRKSLFLSILTMAISIPALIGA